MKIVLFEGINKEENPDVQKLSTDTKNFFLFWVDFPELLNCLSFTKRGLPFVFTPKIPHNRLPEILVCLWWGRAVSALSSDCQIFSDG